MRRRDFLALSGAGGFFALQSHSLPALAMQAVAGPKRGLRIAMDPRLGADTKKAVAGLMGVVSSHPLLKIMANGEAAVSIDTAKLLASKDELAYNHLVLIGFADDPLLKAAWQREAIFEPNKLYVFGFGGFEGTLGYIESDRNPFLHSAYVAVAPFEAEVITLTGTSDEGIALAVRAFAEHGVVNGLVAHDGWKRTETTLLDRSPFVLPAMLPHLVPEKVGSYTRIGWTQAAEDEYRGVLDDTGVEPLQIWRAKYHKQGVWDGRGAATAFDAYSTGLHRRAYGSMLWHAQFRDAKEAEEVAPKIASAARLAASGKQWHGAQPAYANGTYPGERPSSGPITLWQQDEWLLMSTLDAEISTSV